MILIDVMDALETRLKTITGLRVYGWAAAVLTPPGAILTAPERIVPRGAGRALDRIEGISAIVAVSKATERTALRTLSPYASSSGTKSITAVLEGGTYAAFDTVEVKEITIDAIEHAGVPFLGAIHELVIHGPGGTP